MKEFKKLKDTDKNSLFHSGVNVDPVLKKNILFLVLSMLPYFFVQVFAISFYYIDSCIL